MSNELKELIREITEVYGPTGREERIADFIEKRISPYVDEIRRDAMGNLICTKKGTSGKRMMLSAHMDQIGLIVTDIDEKGFLRFAPVGGINPAITACREVVFENGVRGVTYYEQKTVTDGKPTLAQMFIDIGCDSREKAEGHVSIGDICTYAPHFVDMGNRVACGALDDRICCAILIEAMKDMKSPHEICVCFTTQEEVGLRGATAAAYSIAPDFSINMDVTMSADTPECMPLPMKMGEGATIKYMDRSAVFTKPVIDFMRKVANDNGIKTQNEILKAGGTDSGAIQSARGGVASGCVSIVTRYIHSPVEMADLDDCAEAVRLVRALAESEELPLS